LLNDFGMAVDARLPRHPPIARLDLDRLMKILQSKRERVKKAVVQLGDPFTQRAMWKMTVIADCDVAVA
jgi:hypothetical protein